MGARNDSRQGPGGDTRPVEQEAVRTTIVGGRPPGSGKSVGAIPRGIDAPACCCLPNHWGAVR